MGQQFFASDLNPPPRGFIQTKRRPFQVSFVRSQISKILNFRAGFVLVCAFQLIVSLLPGFVQLRRVGRS